MELIRDAIREAELVSRKGRWQPPWPEPLDRAAFHGIVGRIVDTVAPNTEADPAALLAHTLAYAGNAMGSSPHARAEGAHHGTNLFFSVVGETAKGRKGSANAQVQSLFRVAAQDWALHHIKTGLSSGEGLIYHVRDAEMKIADGTPVVADAGVEDKRLLILESELAGPLRKMVQQGNILSPTLRQAWDSGDLNQLTKNSPVHATGAHISLIGHISKPELVRLLRDEDLANGFANRIIWIASRRVRLLPEGGVVPDLPELISELQQALAAGAAVGEMSRDPEAKGLWAEVYQELSDGKPGLIGLVTNRAEAQVQRLQNLYAALDGSSIIRASHLKAALAVWEYAERSVRYVFGDKTGNTLADKILAAMRISNEGLGRNEIWDVTNKNSTAREIAEALDLLERNDLVRSGSGPGGEPRWWAS